ncbi:MAG TPA: hypothetical protein VFB56_05010, partial [Nitrospiraceae bacterium]|nr:hypothetical protein [Nitrospiraceae bacterium]
MEAIIRLRRGSIQRGLTSTEGARHVTGFTEIIERSGRLNEAVMPLKVIGANPVGMLRVIPLGLSMLLKGKVPSPFGHMLPGIEQVRAIFAAFRRRKRPVHP